MPTYCLDLSCLATLARHRGIGRYAANLAEAMHASRALLDPDEHLIALVNQDDAPHFSTDLRPSQHLRPLPPARKRGAELDRYFRRRPLRIPGMLARQGVDLVHFVQGTGTIPSPRYRTVVTCHDLIPLRFAPEYVHHRVLGEPLARLADWGRYALADRIIAISDSTRDDLREYVGVPAARVSVVGHGVDHRIFHPEARVGERARITARYHLPARYLLYVGAVDPRKRLDLLVSRAAELQRTAGVTVVLAGSSWPRSLSRPLAKALRDAPRGAVCLAGEIDDDDLPALYRQAEAHVLPSVFEGFGLSVLEAMACGCPVITTRGGALGEVGGDAACFVPPDDGAAIVEAVRSLATDPVERAARVSAGIAHARGFTWERTARETLAAYRIAAGRIEAAARLLGAQDDGGVTQP